MKTPERRHWRRSGVFIVNLEHISHLVLVFLLLTLNMLLLTLNIFEHAIVNFNVNFEHILCLYLFEK